MMSSYQSSGQPTYHIAVMTGEERTTALKSILDLIAKAGYRYDLAEVHGDGAESLTAGITFFIL